MHIICVCLPNLAWSDEAYKHSVLSSNSLHTHCIWILTLQLAFAIEEGVVVYTHTWFFFLFFPPLPPRVAHPPSLRVPPLSLPYRVITFGCCFRRHIVCCSNLTIAPPLPLDPDCPESGATKITNIGPPSHGRRDFFSSKRVSFTTC